MGSMYGMSMANTMRKFSNLQKYIRLPDQRNCYFHLMALVKYNGPQNVNTRPGELFTKEQSEFGL
jgi:hypothetical protein